LDFLYILGFEFLGIFPMLFHPITPWSGGSSRRRGRSLLRGGGLAAQRLRGSLHGADLQRGAGHRRFTVPCRGGGWWGIAIFFAMEKWKELEVKHQTCDFLCFFQIFTNGKWDFHGNFMGFLLCEAYDGSFLVIQHGT